MWYPSENGNGSLKSCENLFARNLFLSGPTIFKFSTEHGSIIAVLCAKFQNDWATEMDVMNKHNLN